MSQQNVDIVHGFLSLPVDEAMKHVDPDIVWNPIEELPTHGSEAMRAAMEHWRAEWDDYEVIPQELLDVGDSVIATVRLRGRGRGSGIEIDALFHDVYTLRDGKIVRMDQFTERSEARRAVGLDP